MKIRTIIAATCAALAYSMAGPIYAHDSEAQTVTTVSYTHLTLPTILLV